jgi:putative DNA primase/helicase
VSVRKELPFDQVKQTALSLYPGLLEKWLPGGKLEGREYVVLNPTRVDRKLGSFRINIDTGEWGDFATKDAGHDAISLYAYLNFGGTDKDKRTAACRALCVELGLDAGIPSVGPGRSEDDPPKGSAKGSVVPFPVKWQPLVPPPDGVAEPTEILAEWDHVFRYRDRSGNLLRYVVRRDTKGARDKEVMPLTYGLWEGVACWKLKGPGKPRSLYGLERLDGRPVLLFEGEKKCDQVQALLPEIACLSLTGGGGGRNCNDLTPLADQPGVTFAGDNDKPGREVADTIMPQLQKLGCPNLLLDVWSHGFQNKWDLGNAVTGILPDETKAEPWTAEKLREFLRDNSHPYDPDPGNVDLEEPPDDDAEWKEESAPDAPPWWIRPLGQLGTTCYYLCRRSWAVHTATPDQHTKMKLIGMAPLDYWWQTTFGAGGSIQWDKCADNLIRRCEDVGRYRVDTMRGRGAWIDVDTKTGKARTVLHLGGYLLVDGVPHSLDLENSRHVYERRDSIREVIAEPLKSSQAIELYKLIAGLKWEEGDISAKLMSGWIVCALVCGALEWRPHIWVTGGSGAGKTTLEMEIVRVVLGGLVCPLASHSTEAGVRHALDGDALPVVFDEAEAESTHDRHRMQGVLDLGRQSSREGSAPIVKGTQSQTGAKSYTLRSCFMFSSINISMNKLADESRITVLGLKTTSRNDKVAMADYAALRLRISQTLTPEFRAGLLARIVSLMPTIKANALTFSRAAAELLGSNRVGDQIGTLLAGYYALTSSRELTLDEASKIVSDLALDDANSADAERDEQRLLNFLFQQIVTVKVGGSPFDRTIGELVWAAGMGVDNDVTPKIAGEVLLQYGIKYGRLEGTMIDGVWIANKHAQLAEFLKDTPWSANWNRALKRLDGAMPSTAPVWFGPNYPGRPPRAVFVPVTLQKDPL